MHVCASPNLTVEFKGVIPPTLRPLIGNRIYGCDDCQLVFPWNRFVRICAEPDFKPRQGLDRAALLDLFSWSEPEFLKRTEGSAIRRIGYCAWLRNLAVALGDGPSSAAVTAALWARLDHPNALVGARACRLGPATSEPVRLARGSRG